MGREPLDGSSESGKERVVRSPVLLIPEKVNPLLVEAIEKQGLGRLEMVEHLHRDPRALVERVREATVLIIKNLTKVPAPLIAAATRLRLLCRDGIGFENIDIPAATRAGIPIHGPLGANAISVAEFTVGLAIALAKRLIPAHASMARGRWERFQYYGHVTELCGKTAGIVGLGAIGRETAKRVAAFGMRVLAYDPYVDAGASTLVALADLPTLIRESDFVLLHAPQTPETVGMIGEAQLRAMKPTAFLINVARAPLVDGTALRRALSEGWIAGAATDVYETEPPSADDPLGRLPNVIRTPHYAGGSVEATERKALMNVEDIRRALEGRPIVQYVNIPGPRVV